MNASEAPRPSQRSQVLVADDDTVIRLGVRAALEQDASLLVVGGEVRDGPGLLAACRLAQPDLVLMAQDLPELDGLAIVHALHTVSPRTRVVVLTATDAVVASGVAGSISRAVSGAELWEKVRAVLDCEQPTAAQSLSAREVEVLRLLAAGLTNRQIAENLVITL